MPSATSAGQVYFAPFVVELTDINVLQPDLAYFDQSRQSFLTEQGASDPPNLVVEILSPKIAKYDREIKREIYARTGVEELWIVDPDVRLIQVFRLQENAPYRLERYHHLRFALASGLVLLEGKPQSLSMDRSRSSRSIQRLPQGNIGQPPRRRLYG